MIIIKETSCDVFEGVFGGVARKGRLKKSAQTDRPADEVRISVSFVVLGKIKISGHNVVLETTLKRPPVTLAKPPKCTHKGHKLKAKQGISIDGLRDQRILSIES